MELYGQDAETRLLSCLASRLEHRSVIDVGAERGSFATALLDAGVEELYAIEPHPDNVRELHARFDDDSRVKIHEHAVSDSDGQATLHLSSNPDGSPLSFAHSLLKLPDTDEVIWRETLTVARRSLGSLAEAGEITTHAGILKIDTEGHDLAVVRGIGLIEVDIVMVEHWKDLPHGLGPCPWTTEEMTSTLAARGFSHFAFVVHHGDLTTLKWDDGEVARGEMGNLVFLHDRVLGELLPDLLEFSGLLAEEAAQVGARYRKVARERETLVDELKQIADERLELIDELKTAADEFKTAAEDRLRNLEITTQQLRERNAEVESLRHQRA